MNENIQIQSERVLVFSRREDTMQYIYCEYVRGRRLLYCVEMNEMNGGVCLHVNGKCFSSVWYATSLRVFLLYCDSNLCGFSLSLSLRAP